MINFGAYDLLAIDPGNTQSGYVLIRDGKILQSGVLPNTFMLTAVDGFYWNLGDVTKSRDPSVASFESTGSIALHDRRSKYVCIEGIASYGMPVGREVFETCYFIGRIIERVETGWCGSVQIAHRPDIKLHICKSPRAKDPNVRQALLDRWGAPGTIKAKGPTYGVKSHAWSALALATYCIDNRQEPKT